MAVLTRIERVPVDSQLGNRLHELKALGRKGWDVTALLASDERSIGREVVLLACKEVTPLTHDAPR